MPEVRMLLYLTSLATTNIGVFHGELYIFANGEQSRKFYAG